MLIPQSSPILCPIEFSDPSEAALRLAVMVGDRCSRPVIALHAHTVDLPAYFTPSRVEQIERETRGELNELRSQIGNLAARIVPGREIAIRVEEGDPRDVIPRAVRSTGAALIVMATHGRTAMERFTEGSVAEQILHTSEVPVLTVGPADQRESLSRILCAVNDAEVSRRALSLAAELAKCLPAQLTVVHVVEELGRRAIHDLCTWIGQPAQQNCEIREVTRRGHAAKEILGLAREIKAGLLVIGAEPRLLADKTAIGMTTFRVLQQSPCPVLTVVKGVTEHVVSG
jgi:nucleotide-binding universal stress UspA family protein